MLVIQSRALLAVCHLALCWMDAWMLLTKLHEYNGMLTLSHTSPQVQNKKPCYRKDDRAMRPIAYGCSEKNCESLATPTANFPDILMHLFWSIRKKSCGSGAADNRVRSPHTVCAAAVWRWDFPLPRRPSYWKLEQGLFIATTFHSYFAMRFLATWYILQQKCLKGQIGTCPC